MMVPVWTPENTKERLWEYFLCSSYSSIEDSYSSIEDSYSSIEDSYSSIEDSYSSIEDSYVVW